MMETGINLDLLWGSVNYCEELVDYFFCLEALM